MYDLPQMGKYKGVYEMDKDIITNFENLYRAYKKGNLVKVIMEVVQDFKI